MEKEPISTRRINLERFSVTSRKSLQDVLSKFDAAVGHPNIEEFWKRMTAAKTRSEMKRRFSQRLDRPDSWSLHASITAESCTKERRATIQKFFDSSSGIR
jgi:hypothetical protein